VVLEIVATLSAGIFAGAATYITLVEHPARVEAGTVVALKQFAPSYHRATLIQAPLALIGLTSGVSAALVHGDALWALGGLVLGAVVPLTLIVIFPTNRQLLDAALENESPLAGKLLARWGRLHALRTLVGLVAFAFFVALLASD